MKNISINVVGFGTEQYPTGTTPLELLSSIKGVSNDTLICKVDKVLMDLSVKLENDCTVQFLDGKSKDGHSVLLHSTAHLMAQAVKRLFPKTKVTIGPFLENRFYYDFDVVTPFTEDDLLSIEKEMLKISEEKIDIVHDVKSIKEALEYFKDIGEDYIEVCPRKDRLFPYALEILDYLKQKYTLHIITNGFDKTQHIKLEHSNLTPYFNQIITSEKTGFKKPNPKIFEHALDLANAKDIESIYIGDNLVVDILACQNAGIDGIYFNPEKKSHNEKISFEVSCLSQIKEIL